MSVYQSQPLGTREPDVPEPGSSMVHMNPPVYLPSGFGRRLPSPRICSWSGNRRLFFTLLQATWIGNPGDHWTPVRGVQPPSDTRLSFRFRKSLSEFLRQRDGRPAVENQAHSDDRWLGFGLSETCRRLRKQEERICEYPTATATASSSRMTTGMLIYFFPRSS